VSEERHEPGGNPCSVKIGNHADARPKNWLVPVTLVMLRQGSSYGYELLERSVELGFEMLNAGTLYRTLRKMENEGLCESEWQTDSSSGRPARRMYSITDAGEAYLSLWVESLEHYQKTLDALLLAYKSGVSPARK
jgi:PadR family transcriptional regulator, regulatory protein PadR